VSWLLAGSGWALVLLLTLMLRGRRSLVADAEHELRGAITTIGLAAERMRRVGATRAFASLVALQIDRVEAALVDLRQARRLRLLTREPAGGEPARTASRIDAGRLSQIVANLVDNAAEHGTGPVEVRWSATGSGARLEIRNGNRPPGLDERGAARAAGRGRGLGIAARAARELGAGLRVDSGDEVTAATLELPAVAERTPRRTA
jgi:signal transduction histidine kinase